MLGIVVSRADSASTHIADHLLNLADWERSFDTTQPDIDGGGTVYRSDGIELRAFDDLHLDLEGVDGRFDDPDLLAFASRHAGDTGPLLSVHHTGNFGPAEYGGNEGKFARGAPNALATALGALDDHAPPGYDVGLECTHHGPTGIDTPSLFIELGSDEPQWDDPQGARAVAEAIFVLQDVEPDRDRTLVGFGGGHYVPQFERIVRETDWTVGHTGADWALAAMGPPAENESVISRAFERSDASRAVFEGERPNLRRIVDDLGYQVVSETWVRETSDVPLALVGAIEDALGSVAAGVRFGEPAIGYEGAFAVVDLPAELLEEAARIDRETTRAAIDERTVAFETTENGTKPTGRVAFPECADRDAVVDALCDVLARKYDAVRRHENEVLARGTSFDPGRARELGVPEGPAFGRLAAGTAVEIDDRVIDPAEVRVERERQFDTGFNS